MHPRAAPVCVLALLALFLGACGEEGPGAPRTMAPTDDATAPPRLSGKGSSAPTRESRVQPPPLAPSPFPAPRLGGVEVRVVARDGTPLEGACVADVHRSQRTDAEGRASVGPFRGGHGMPSQCRRERTIRVDVDGYAPIHHECEGGGDGTEVVRVLDRGAALEGRCIDSSGHPVSDVQLRLAYERGPNASIRTGTDGRFRLEGAPRQEGRLAIREDGWTCRPRIVVPPETDIELVVYRTAWIRGRFAATRELGRGYHGRLSVETNQGWRAPLRHDEPFAIPCCPGEVVVRWNDRTLARFKAVEGVSIKDVEIPIDITFHHREGSTEHPTIDLEPFAIHERETFLAAYYEDLGVRRLGYFKGRDVERVILRSPALRWISVEPDSGAWRVAARAGERVRITRPPLAPITLRLLDAGAHPISEGWVQVRWTGTRHAAGHAHNGRAQAAGVFRSGPMGCGSFDLLWQPGHDRPARLLLRSVVMPDPPAPLDLGDIVVPDPLGIRVAVLDAHGEPVAGAVVRLVGRARHAAARTDRDGVSTLIVPDPTGLELEAVGPDGRRAAVRLPDDPGPGVVTIRVR